MDQVVAQAKGGSMSFPSSKDGILAELQTYPAEWKLTPVKDKRPYRREWQTEQPLSVDVIATELLSGKARGVGIRSGRVSGGILCIDFDGHSALNKYLQLSGGVAPPLTIGWTSGKPGRWQLGFQVPPEQWDAIATKKIQTGWDSNGKATEFLEIRWDGTQSVLPPSIHPETGCYHWLPGQSPQECEVAPVPEWILGVAKPEPKYQPAERVETDPSLDAWDIRNFAYLLDDYSPDGRRRGWITSRCEAHSGRSIDSLHINQTTGAFKCHAGCDSKAVYHAALELAKSRGYEVPERRTGHSFSASFGWLPRLKKQLEKLRKSPWGFGPRDKTKVKADATTSSPAIEYQPNEQLDVWGEVVKRGGKNILVTDPTGCGKSYYAGMATPELFDARQLIYLSSEHRNPSTPTLKSWPDLEARHNGLVRDQFGKLRRANSGQPYVISPNCARRSTVNALRGKNVQGADTSGLICQTCPYLEPCQAGAVFGFLHDRAQSLRQPRLRAHPDSLPSQDEYDYGDVVLFWDEAMELVKAHRSISVTVDDLQHAIASLALKLPEVFDLLRPVLLALHPYLSGVLQQVNRYGWKDAEIRRALPKLESVDAAVIAKVLLPDLSFLNATEGYGVDLADLPSKLRKHFSDSDAQTAEQVSRR